MDPILSLLVEAHGENLGRLVYGAYRLAQTAAEHAQKRSEAEAALRTVRDAAATRDGDNAAHGEVST